MTPHEELHKKAKTIELRLSETIFEWAEKKAGEEGLSTATFLETLVIRAQHRDPNVSFEQVPTILEFVLSVLNKYDPEELEPGRRPHGTPEDEYMPEARDITAYLRFSAAMGRCEEKWIATAVDGVWLGFFGKPTGHAEGISRELANALRCGDWTPVSWKDQPVPVADPEIANLGYGRMIVENK